MTGAQAMIPLDLDLLRGYGVFETLQTYEGRKFFRVKEHLQRLFASAQKIGLSPKYGPGEVLGMLKKISQKSKYERQRIKLVLLPGSVLLFSTPVQQLLKEQKGVTCLSLVCERYLPEVKSISYLPSFLSHELARKKGYAEAILVNREGEVFEGAYSNIFWFEGQTLCTRGEQVLPGIIRQAILDLALFPVSLKRIKLAQLKQCQEIFLTSSVQLITPIIKIDQRRIGEGRPGKNTLLLRARLLAEIKAKGCDLKKN